MYSIFAGTQCIYDDKTPLPEYKVSSPVLTLSDSAAGSLEMTLPACNIGYNLINRMDTEIIVKRNGTEIWRGRVLEDYKDWYNNRKLVCEGELTYLNDSIQAQASYTLGNEYSVRTILTAMINSHNEQMRSQNRVDKTFEIGTIQEVAIKSADVGKVITTDYETTLDCINDKIIGNFEGHIILTRNSDGKRVFNYYHTISEKRNNQAIRFGQNLLDYATSIDCDEYTTVVIPLGKKQDTQSTSGLDNYLTIANSSKTKDHSIYISNDKAVNQFGKIIKVVKFDDCEDADKLYDLGKAYIDELWNANASGQIFENVEIDVTMLDLNYLDNTIENIELLDTVACISPPHGYTEEVPLLLPVKELKIYLAEPDKTKITLGDKVKQSLTEKNNDENSEIKKKIEDQVDEYDILKKAKQEALSLLNDGNGGYVTFPTNSDGKVTAVHISDASPETASTRQWVFNVNGLGHRYREQPSDDWKELNVAMTMDGKIVADKIITGILDSCQIRGVYIAGCDINGGKFYSQGELVKPYNSAPSTKIENGKIEIYSDGYNDYFKVHQFNDPRYYWAIGGQYFRVVAPEPTPTDYWLETIYIALAAQSAKDASDRRLKTNIETLNKEQFRDIIRSIRPVSFDYLDEQANRYGKHFGVIAQELREVLNENGIDESSIEHVRLSDDMRTVEYKEFIAPLISCVQDLYSEIDDLKSQITELKEIIQNGR